MKASHLLLLGVLAAPIACAETPEPVAPPPPTAAPTAETAPPPAKPAELTPEEKKKAEEAQKKAEAADKLAADRAQLAVDAASEDARWTPETHAAAKKLASTKWPNAKAAITAAQKGGHRKTGNAARDAYRHPLETLEFWGLKPNMTVLEYSPGEGWWTELLAPTLATSGKLMINIGDVKGPKDQRGTYYAERLALFLDRAPEIYGKIERIVTPTPIPSFGLDGKVDLMIVSRNMHGMVRNKQLGGFLAEAMKALKPGGVLGVEQHRAKAGAEVEEAAKKGYLPEEWLIKEIEGAGFKLAAKSEINANAKDTKDYPEGVWALPPTLEGKEKDKAKLLAIGESDRMTLRFVKPAAGKDAKAAPAAKPAAAKPAAAKPAAKPAPKKK
jgi:predicted methyltransferase